MSALMPSGRPTSLTRSMNAGGNAYSRPHNRPTFIARVSDVVRARRLVDAGARFGDDRLDDGTEIPFLFVNAQLPIGAGAVGENRPHVRHLAPAPQLVDHIVDELEELECEIAHRHFGAAAEVDQLAIDAVPRGAPFALLDQAAV